ncbi:MAG: hypothetical protein ACRDHM_06855 [Actinomycetota bacterium]
MRSTVKVALVGICVAVALVSESLAAGSEPNVTAPASVEKGEAFKITIRNCQSGSNYSAYITWSYTKPDGTEVDAADVGPDADGTTDLPVSLDAIGYWIHRFTCEHRFSGGDPAVFWQEGAVIEVQKPTPTLTDQERKKCKKKRTRAARRRCLRRERAD